jgi:antitoxin component of MazEF toxin-antitoxin module
MIKKLTKHGNSMAVVLDRPILELLKIDENTPLEVSTDGQKLIISPIHSEKNKNKLKTSMEKFNKKYGKALKKLA